MSKDFGISNAHLPASFPAFQTFNSIGLSRGFFPCLLGAIAWEETLKVLPLANAMSYISYDNGHGVMQLTDSWPSGWKVLSSNLAYAVDDYLMPALKQWTSQTTLMGDVLVKCVAATYNAGFGQAWEGHLNGNVDQFTENGDYGARVLADYTALVSGIVPAGVSNPSPS